MRFGDGLSRNRQQCSTGLTTGEYCAPTRSNTYIVKPVTLVANKLSSAGPNGFLWDGKVNKKLAAKGRWEAKITAVSGGRKATLTQFPITIR